MPKVVVYVRAEDARAIEATEGRDIELWVRAIVRDEINTWHDKRAKSFGARYNPELWPHREGEEDAV